MSTLPQSNRRSLAPLGHDAPGASLCPWCGYDLVGLEDHACPECGRAFGPAEAASVAARHRLVASAPRIWLRFFGLPMAVSVALLAILLAMGAHPGPSLSILFIGVALPLITAAAGAPVMFLSRPWERRAVMLSWLRHSWWLHLGLLVLPALVMLAWLATEFFNASSLMPDPFVLTLIIVVPPWATVIIVGVLAWCGAWFESERYIKHRPRIRGAAVFLAVGASLLAAISATIIAGIAIALNLWGIP